MTPEAQERIRRLDALLARLEQESAAGDGEHPVTAEKPQTHLDTQAKEAIKQATRRLLENITSQDIIAEEVTDSPGLSKKLCALR